MSTAATRCLLLPGVLLAVPLPLVFRQEESAPGTRILERCRAELEKVHARSDFPGGSAALALPDGTELTFTVGLASARDEVELSTKDRMLSGSIGKTYVAAAALHMIQAGELSLDDKAEKFFAEEWFKRIPNAKDITLRQLLRHQSGIPRYVLVPGFWKVLLKDKDKVWKPEELLSHVLDKPARFPAGKGWSYADTNFILVGMILERVSGSEIHDYIQQHFLEPHGLEDTIPSDRRELPGLVQGHVGMFRSLGVPERVLEEGVFVFNPQFEWCGGGYLNTALDLARWARILYSGKAFDGEYLKTMLDAVPADGLGAGTKYGIGVIVRKTEAGTLLGHDGVFPGYQSTMGYFPGLGIAAAVQINRDGGIRTPMHRMLVTFATIAKKELGL
ncbi:MAG: serine hydrolase domain-containing protein [Planctomycetota bacterium]